MPKSPEQPKYDFSKPEDQEKFDELPKREQKATIKEAQNEGILINKEQDSPSKWEGYDVIDERGNPKRLTKKEQQAVFVETKTDKYLLKEIEELSEVNEGERDKIIDQIVKRIPGSRFKEDGPGWLFHVIRNLDYKNKPLSLEEIIDNSGESEKIKEQVLRYANKVIFRVENENFLEGPRWSSPITSEELFKFILKHGIDLSDLSEESIKYISNRCLREKESKQKEIKMKRIKDQIQRIKMEVTESEWKQIIKESE